MKKLYFASFMFFVSPLVSFAQPYPVTCPAEAQGVLEAVGGCSGIDSSTYANIYEKCCVQAVSNSNLVIYALVGMLILALIIWLILKRKKF